MDLSIRMASWRKARGLKQNAVANACKVSVSAVSLWESGGARPSQQHLEAFVELLGIGMARFYGRVPKAKAVA